MDEKERNEQFKGFAQLLFDEFPQMLDDESYLGMAKADWQLAVKKLISQRTYDLVFHILKNTDSIYLDMIGYNSDSDIQQNISHIPDLTKWPEYDS